MSTAPYSSTEPVSSPGSIYHSAPRIDMEQELSRILAEPLTEEEKTFKIRGLEKEIVDIELSFSCAVGQVFDFAYDKWDGDDEKLDEYIYQVASTGSKLNDRDYFALIKLGQDIKDCYNRVRLAEERHCTAQSLNKLITGRNIAGRMELVFGRLEITLKVWDEFDFNRIYRVLHGFMPYDSAGGFVMHDFSAHPELSEIFFCQLVDEDPEFDGKFIDHEREHIRFRMLSRTAFYRNLKSDDTWISYEPIFNSQDPAEREQHLIEVLRRWRLTPDTHTKDELLAMLAEKNPPREDDVILDLLTRDNSPYNFVKDIAKYLTYYFVTHLGVQNRDMIERAVCQVLITEKDEAVRKALNAFRRLQNAHVLDESTIRIALGKEPITEWESIVDRIISSGLRRTSISMI